MSDPSPASGVRIREVQDDDLELFYRHQRDPEGVRMAAVPVRDRAAFLAHWARIRADPTTVLRTVVVDGQVAGNVVSWPESGQRLVGYWVGREFWGRGVATGGLALFVGQVRQRPLHAHVAVHNIGSIRVLEKCGFRRVATTLPPSAADDVEEAAFVLDA